MEEIPAWLITVYQFIETQDIPVYFLGSIGLIYGVIQLARSRYILQRAMFNLERENGEAIRFNAITYLLVCGILVGGVYYLNAQIIPDLPGELFAEPTPTPNVFALASPTPINTPVPPPNRPIATPNLVATATLDAELADVTGPERLPVPTPNLEAPAAAIPEVGGCTPAVNIREPQTDATVFGTVSFFGSASAPDFAAYTLEMRGLQTGANWINILGDPVFSSVDSGLLGAVNLVSLPDGRYDVRLSVVNLSGDITARCIIGISVVNE